MSTPDPGRATPAARPRRIMVAKCDEAPQPAPSAYSSAYFPRPQMPDPADRSILTQRLRHMADWLDAHPGIPVSRYCSVTVSYFTNDPTWINQVQHQALDSHFTREQLGEYDCLSYGDRAGEYPVHYQLSVRKPEAPDGV